MITYIESPNKNPVNPKLRLGAATTRSPLKWSGIRSFGLEAGVSLRAPFFLRARVPVKGNRVPFKGSRFKGSPLRVPVLRVPFEGSRFKGSL